MKGLVPIGEMTVKVEAFVTSVLDHLHARVFNVPEAEHEILLERIRIGLKAVWT